MRPAIRVSRWQATDILFITPPISESGPTACARSFLANSTLVLKPQPQAVSPSSLLPSHPDCGLPTNLNRSPRALTPTVRACHCEYATAGDILFITPSISKFGPTAPGAIRISHAIVWTGHTVDFTTTGRPFSWDTIIANVNPKDQASMMGYVNARRAAGLPVYVITDSHWTGPNYRPFAGEAAGLRRPRARPRAVRPERRSPARAAARAPCARAARAPAA